jgi:hypothetical protein
LVWANVASNGKATFSGFSTSNNCTGEADALLLAAP